MSKWGLKREKFTYWSKLFMIRILDADVGIIEFYIHLFYFRVRSMARLGAFM